MEARQLIDDVVTMTVTTAQPTGTSAAAAKGARCPSVNLQPGGIIILSDGQVVTLKGGTVYKPPCITTPIIANGGGGTISIQEVDGGVDAGGTSDHLSDFGDPFYASIFPQCYALAATTIVAYTLVIMLLITPRSFLDGGVVVLGRKGFTNGGSGTNIGGRPWLQKVAALTVAISLTIATAATFRVAEDQHADGYFNAKMIQQDVLGGLEIKIIRIISDTFLWLAQAQTLIRLFPRQREKVIIKWTAFALISLDVVFQSLNSFQYMGQGAIRPRSFTDAVPALSYLFALSLGVLYAAWVIYYSLMKKRYAFYHPQMKNICLVAALSMLAILVPVVFFILDISKPEFTGWGDYVRWVGAAAASVIVWEWVERIEALEREEKKDGILGREVFDGDEMEATLADIGWSRRRRKGPDYGDGESGRKETGNGQNDGTSTARSHLWPHVTSIASRYRSRSRQRKADQPKEATATQPTNHDRIRFPQPPLWPARPPPAVTPVSRTDTASAASTIYAVRYHPLTETTSRPSPPPPIQNNDTSLARTDSNASTHRREEGVAGRVPDIPADTQESIVHRDSPAPSAQPWWRSVSRGVTIPRVNWKNKEDIPTTTSVEDAPRNKPGERDSSAGWDIRTRFEEFAVTQAERIRERIRPTPDTDSLPVTVIPAPPRRGAAVAQLREEEQLELAQRRPRRNSIGVGGSSTEDGSSPASSNQYNIYSAEAGIGSSARGDASLFGRRSSRTLLPVTVIPAPPRRDGAVSAASSPALPAAQGTYPDVDPDVGAEPRVGSSSPPS